MAAANFVIRGQRVVLADSLAPASIHIAGETIVRIAGYDEVPQGDEVITADDEAVVMPGLVDTHVHINDPGRSEWEGFATATRAAAAGGVTTLVDMPLNSIPPTTSLSGLNAKLAAARGRCSVDVGFWGGVVPGNTRELQPLLAAGVVGFKCFLIDSGVAEFPNVTEADLREAMPLLAKLNALLIVHAELPGPIQNAGVAEHPDPTAYATFLASRPRAAEDEAVALMIKLSREFGARVHIVHHSSADSLPMLQAAKNEGVMITAETCPHYLTFAAEDIPDGATEFKCCPPIRERENREQLWAALATGTIDFVVSDHSPCTADLKLQDTGNFLEAWGGIASLQLRLPAVWSEARERGFSLPDLSRWLCSAPAKLVGLDERKGSIAVGNDADLVIWNPEKEFRVDREELEHRNKVTPYHGRVLHGLVEKTFLRGQKIYDDGTLTAEAQGKLLATS